MVVNLSWIFGTLFILWGMGMTLVFFYVFFMILLRFEFGENVETIFCGVIFFLAVICYTIGWWILPLALVIT